MTAYDPSARLIWSLASSGLSTTLATGSASSGTWGGSAPNVGNALSAVDLRQVTDAALYVTVGAKTGSASLTVALDGFDDLGNLVTGLMTTSAITTGSSSTVLSCGLHGATATSYVVFPAWGRVSWTLTGANSNFAACEIALVGR